MAKAAIVLAAAAALAGTVLLLRRAPPAAGSAPETPGRAAEPRAAAAPNPKAAPPAVPPAPSPTPAPVPTYAELLAGWSGNEALTGLAGADADAAKALELLGRDAVAESREAFRAVRKALARCAALERAQLEQFAAAVRRQEKAETRRNMEAAAEELARARLALEAAMSTPEGADEVARDAAAASEAADDVSDAIRDGKGAEARRALVGEFERKYETLRGSVRRHLRR